MTNAEKYGLKLNLTNIQYQYLKDITHRFFIISAGRRSRKTLIGQKKVFLKGIENPETKYFLGAPTHQQAKQIFWTRLKRQATSTGMLKRYYESSMEIELINNSLIRVVGLDKPERIEGETPSWDGCHITEFPNIKEHAWTEHIRPTLSDRNGFAILDGVPDFRHPHYEEMARYACGGQIPKTYSKMGAFAENPSDKEWCYYSWFSSDVLNEYEIESAKRSMDLKIYKQEYEGSFERAGGVVYYALTDKNVSEAVYEPNRTICLCYDFNINPMTVIVNQLIGDKWHFVKEFIHYESNTPEATLAVRDYLESTGFSGALYLTGDYTGTARKTSAVGGTDWQIIRSMLAKYNPIWKVRKVYLEKDRINTMNGAFMNTLGEINQYINPKECPKLYKEFITIPYTDDGQIDDMSGQRGHFTDAASYHAYNWFSFYDNVTEQI